MVEPAHLIKYAPAPEDQAPLRRSVRKRRVHKHGEKVTTRKRANTDNRKAPKQRRVSESLRVAKPVVQSFTHKLDGSTDEPLSTPASAAPAVELPHPDNEERACSSITGSTTHAPPVETYQTHATMSTDDGDDFGQLCFDFEPTNHITNHSAHKSELPQNVNVHVDEDDFQDDDLMDDDLLEFSTDTVDASSPLKLQSSSPIKINVVDESSQVTCTPGPSVDNTRFLEEETHSSSSMLKKFISPVTLTTRLVAATSDEAHKPIVRPAFPAPVRDRSPIIGLTNNILLRTCFRVGEAINQSCQAVKAGNNILIELYARVLNSERDGLQQRFTFCDLFHAKPPYIQAVYAAAIWKSVQLFEYDSARLLQQGRICRCIGTMKRDGRDWVMTVLNVWEATWDDVQWVEGIVHF